MNETDMHPLVMSCDIDDCDEYGHNYELDDEAEEEESCCRTGCMKCLGMSWRDFF